MENSHFSMLDLFPQEIAPCKRGLEFADLGNHGGWP